MCQGVIVIKVAITIWQISIDKIANCTLGNRSNSLNLCPLSGFDGSTIGSEYCSATSAGSGRRKKNVIKNEIAYMKLATTHGPVVNSLTAAAGRIDCAS